RAAALQMDVTSLPRIVNHEYHERK
ncbi:MAG: hypothetical protein QOH08_1816, partial [Chloroflexota bacterium]|nr:hypothetical protein [Chloroflexota bacterium]